MPVYFPSRHLPWLFDVLVATTNLHSELIEPCAKKKEEDWDRASSSSFVDGASFRFSLPRREDCRDVNRLNSTFNLPSRCPRARHRLPDWIKIAASPRFDSTIPSVLEQSTKIGRIRVGVRFSIIMIMVVIRMVVKTRICLGRFQRLRFIVGLEWRASVIRTLDKRRDWQRKV